MHFEAIELLNANCKLFIETYLYFKFFQDHHLKNLHSQNFLKISFFNGRNYFVNEGLLMKYFHNVL